MHRVCQRLARISLPEHGTMVSWRTLLACTVALASLTACSRSNKESAEGSVSRSWNPLDVKEVRDVPIATLREEIGKQLATMPKYAAEDEWSHVKRLYKGYQNSPLWLDDDGLIKNRADALVDALVNATTDGIQIDEYPIVDVAYALDTLRRIKDGASATQLARADLLLTTAFVALGEDYLTGQIDPRTVGQSWHIDPQEEEVDSALVRSLRDRELAEAMVRMRPQDADYDHLRGKLADYRKLVSAGGWKPIPAGKALKRGDRDNPARLHALRSRLRAEGFEIGGSDSASTYDQSLAAAVAKFQEHHAIVVDSQLGKETLDAMNVSATFRLAQITANLERYRWLPRTFGTKYIRVNVPAFRLEGFENGKKTIEMKVIVGAEYEGRATPVFSDMMEHVIFRPYWDVPPNIARNEFTGGIPGDFDVSSRNGEMHLRQRPGPKNALGLVKFMFPNDFNIYLHDTPNDKLFEKDVRAFSHGCIRLEKPDEMARWVLGWDIDRVREAMNSGPNDRLVKLPQKIPVYIAYFTTFVRDGQLWFGNDLYRRDSELAQAAIGGAVPSANAVRAIEALRKLTD
jgi:murein L,D-transpeptidase YcbB/YkuD